MRYIHLRHIEDPKAEPPIDFDYLAVIKTILSGAQMPQGVTYGEISQSLNILDKINEQMSEDHIGGPNEYLALEDAEHTFLSEWVKQHKWPRVHKVIHDFCDAIVNAPKKMPEMTHGEKLQKAADTVIEAAATG